MKTTLEQELIESIALFDRFIEWGWANAAYSVARDSVQSGVMPVPERFAKGYIRMQEYIDAYVEDLVRTGYSERQKRC